MLALDRPARAADAVAGDELDARARPGSTAASGCPGPATAARRSRAGRAPSGAWRHARCRAGTGRGAARRRCSASASASPRCRRRRRHGSGRSNRRRPAGCRRAQWLREGVGCMAKAVADTAAASDRSPAGGSRGRGLGSFPRIRRRRPRKEAAARLRDRGSRIRHALAGAWLAALGVGDDLGDLGVALLDQFHRRELRSPTAPSPRRRTTRAARW